MANFKIFRDHYVRTSSKLTLRSERSLSLSSSLLYFVVMIQTKTVKPKHMWRGSTRFDTSQGEICRESGLLISAKPFADFSQDRSAQDQNVILLRSIRLWSSVLFYQRESNIDTCAVGLSHTPEKEMTRYLRWNSFYLTQRMKITVHFARTIWNTQ